MKNKRPKHRRKNPIQSLSPQAAASIGETLLAQAIGNFVLDFVHPLKDGPRHPRVPFLLEPDDADDSPDYLPPARMQ